MDEFLYPEVLSLSSNSSIKKEISYLAPVTLSGDYTVLIKVKNQGGMPLGMGIAGKVKLTSTVKTIEILTDTCNLSVVGEKGNIKYNLIQGVDIATTENLTLTCIAINASNQAVTASPSFETYLRNIYGERVLQEGGDIAPLTFKAGEKKNITLNLPKATKPQSYDIKFALKSGEVFSNYVTAHYVIQGLSATIQNFSLDKDYYSKNDVANISFTWTPSADNFPGSRIGNSVQTSALTLLATISDGNNKECISPLTQNFSDGSVGGNINLTAPITADCKNPQAVITIKDSNGNILDQKFLSFETKTDKTMTDIKYGSSKTILIVFGILVVLGFAFYFINLKRKENETINQ